MDFNKVSIQDLQLRCQLDVNPASGSVTGSVQIPVPEGRGGFGPALALQYSSASRNSAFGIGWSLAGISFISIDTKKGLPKYDGTDVYAFNGGGKLVPLLGNNGLPQIQETPDYWIYHYRLTVEASFMRFEKWVQKNDRTVHWRITAGDNSVSVYGIRDGVISHPQKKENIFIWLLEEQYDNKGNTIIYKYKDENADQVDGRKQSEGKRIKKGNETGFPQKYPERILYGNTVAVLPNEPIPAGNKWLFEVVFDYGEYAAHPYETNIPSGEWTVRQDPFSVYNAGFEIRNYRLCRRILSYHNIPELSAKPSLTRIFEINYQEHPLGTTIEKVRFTGVRRDLVDGTYSTKTLPPLSFSYTQSKPETFFKQGVAESNINVPQGFNSSTTKFIDLFGEGLPGILTETANNWYYKPNRGNGLFEKQEIIISKPSQLLGIYSLGDFDQDGNLNLFTLQGRTAGYYEYDTHRETWSGFNAFKNIPQVSNAKFIDIDADGFADLVVEDNDSITCYPFEGREGFGRPFAFSKPVSNGVEYAPVLGDNVGLDYFMADMTGDGLPDQVRIKNGKVAYYPNLGNGHFGEVVLMENAPVIDYENDFDASRIRLYDLDGSGTSDIIYLGRGEIRYWYNAAGNSFVEGGTITGLPYIDLLSSAIILDLLGNGTPCLVWSSSLNTTNVPIQFLALTSGEKPRLLTELDNGMGALTQIRYGFSGDHYLASLRKGTPWISKIPAHFTVANQKIVIDTVTNSRMATTYQYFDGHYDGNERGFVCFGRIEQYDVETFENPSLTHEKNYTQPSCNITWLHPGLFGWDTQKAKQYYQKDSKQPLLPLPFFESAEALSDDDFTAGYRSLAGKVIRQETYGVRPDGVIEEHPFSVIQRSYAIRKVQPGTEKKDACFHAFQTEALELAYDRVADDPKVAHHLSLQIDAFGNTTRELNIAYARRNTTGIHALQGKDYITLAAHTLLHTNTRATYLTGILFESKRFELNHIARNTDKICKWQELKSSVDDWINNAISFDQSLPDGGNTIARLMDWNRTYFWNDAQTDVLPLGQSGNLVLAHHEETACFNDSLINKIYGGKVTNAMLSDEDEGNYVLSDGCWWQRTAVNHFAGLAEFYSLEQVEKRPGVFTSYEYDGYFLCVVEITDPLGNKSSGEIDYNIVEPHRLIDVNDNVSEVLYDTLGVPVVTSHQGSVLHNGVEELYGNGLIGNYNRRSDDSFDAIIANPDLYIQTASTFLFYDFDNFPLRSVRITRENLLHDGKGNVDNAMITQVDLDYQDGFGRIIQSKRKVEPGPAIQRHADGTVNTDAAGEPVLTNANNRWVVSGHVVYNNKQLPVRQFEPFFSAGYQFENDTILEDYGVSVQQYYDAVGRMYRSDFPDATFSETLFTPWEVRSFDQNDTVDRSLFKVLREAQPSGSPERMALDKSLQHKETPAIVQFDPLGRAIVRVETNNNGTVRNIETHFDINGNPLQIIDARDIKAFEYKRDMLGRLLYEKSVDAGEKWSFHNNDDHTIHCWDSRNIHQRTSYDDNDRVTSVYVDGMPGLNKMTERFVYGEEALVVQAKERNLRGTLVIHYDQAGIQELKLAAPGNLPLLTERSLLNQFIGEPDWTNPTAVALAPDVYASRYDYDALGRPVAQQLPDQTTRNYLFNQGGGLQKILLSTADGVLNDIEILKDSRYDAKGMRQYITLGNDVAIDYTYDADTFRMKRLRAKKTTGTSRIYQDIHYTYDPVGNLIHLVDAAQQPAATDPKVLEGMTVSAHAEFEYDALYQLLTATGRVHQSLLQNDFADRSRETGISVDWGRGTRHITLNNGAAVERYTRTYEYDEAGNITTIKHSGTSQNWTKEIWTSATSNRSLPLLDLNGTAVSNQENRFDANGNCIYMPHLRSLEWNYRNNISKAIIIDRSGQGKANDEEYYVYGGDGLRVRKITQRLVDVANDTIELTEKIYLEGCEIKRITLGATEILKRFTSAIGDGDNTLARLHSWEKDTHGRETDDIAQKKIHYQLANHLGSAAMELDEQGDIITYEEYFPYGGTAFIAGRNRRDIDLKEYRYSDKERDDFTGLYYFGYRYYAHWIGGWINPDPLGPEDSENLYLYVQNNPINLVDPNGLQSTETGGVNVTNAPLPREQWEALTQAQRDAIIRGDFVLGSGEILTRDEVQRRIDAGQRFNLHNISGISDIREDHRWQEFRDMGMSEEEADSIVDMFRSLDEALASIVVPTVTGDSESTETGRGNGDTAGTGDTTGTGVNNGNGGQGTEASTGDGVNPGDGGSGTAGVGGNGPGAGRQNAGSGGGGTSGNAAGSGTSAATGTGNGSGAGTAQSRGGGRTEGQGANRNGQRGGQPGGTPDGVEGGRIGGTPGGQLGVGLDGAPTGSADGDINGDVNGVPDGIPNGTLDGSAEGTEQGNGSQPGNGTQGTGQEAGEEGSGDNQRENQGQPGQSGQNGDSRTNWMDTATRWAGYLNFEFGGDEGGGEAGGIPGGLDLFGWRPPMWVRRAIQVAYIALTIVTTIIPIGKAALAAKVAIQGALKVGLRATARRALTMVASNLPTRAGAVLAIQRFRGGVVSTMSQIGGIFRRRGLQNIRIEAQALMRQGLSRREAFQQIRRFNAGHADGFTFHFTKPTAGRGIVQSGEVWATRRGLAGPGLYTGTVPNPNFFQRYASPIGWGVNPGSSTRIPIRLTEELLANSRNPFLPRWTRVLGTGESIILKP